MNNYDQYNSSEWQAFVAQLQQKELALLDKKAAGDLHADEEIQLQEIQEILFDAELKEVFPLIEVEQGWQAISSKMQVPKTVRLNPIVKYLAYAASVAAIVIGIWFYSNPSGMMGEKLVTGDLSASNITPGKQGATLTLSNGKKISLTEAINGELAKESGISITKTADGQLVYEIASQGQAAASYNTLTTAKGETYQLRLPDGSRVWLNAASSITYSANLVGNSASGERPERSVKLDGEAYFEVAKDKSHPFVVSSKNQRVEVLGTHFNINAYPDENAIKTTLLEGAVKISSAKGSETPKVAILKPSQQAVLNASGQLSVKSVNTEDIISWKEGDFVFNNEDFKTTMRKIARWYDVEIVYDASVPENIQLAGWVSINGSLSKVLERIAQAGKLHFKIEGRSVTVTK